MISHMTDTDLHVCIVNYYYSNATILNILGFDIDNVLSRDMAKVHEIGTSRV